jgi:hypothetical protein
LDSKIKYVGGGTIWSQCVGVVVAVAVAVAEGVKRKERREGRNVKRIERCAKMGSGRGLPLIPKRSLDSTFHGGRYGPSGES